MSTSDESSPVTDTGKPQKRIKDAQCARDILRQFQTDDQQAAVYRTKIQGLIDGNPPYDASKLKSRAQSWRANLNYREAEGIIDSNTAAFWELLIEVPSLIEVTVDDSDEIWSADYGHAIAEAYTKTMFEWKEFNQNFLMMIKEFLSTGIGPIYWPDKHDVRFRTAKRGSFLFPPRARCNVSELPIVLMLDTIEPYQLYAAVEADKQAETPSWNHSAVMKVLIDQYKGKQGRFGKDGYSGQNQERVQQAFKNNDLGTSYSEFDAVPLVHFLIGNEDGSVSRYIIHENIETKDFLYENDDEAELMEHLLCPILYGIGDGYYRSIKGMGHKIFNHIELSNRLMNSTVDGAMISSSLIVKSLPGKRDDSRMMKMGPIVMLNEHVEPVQTSFAPRLQDITGVRNTMQLILNNNTGVYKRDQEMTNRPSRTAAEVKLAAQNEAVFNKNQVAFFYSQLDELHREIFRRLVSKDFPSSWGDKSASRWQKEASKLRKAFHERCEKKDIPRDVLNVDRCKVRSMRSVGSGSAGMRGMIMNEILNRLPLLGEAGRRAAIRDWLSGMVGYSSSYRYFEQRSPAAIRTTEHSIANLENNDFAEGVPCVVGEDQPHTSHIDMHLKPMVDIAMQMEANIDKIVNPDPIIKQLAVGMSHVQEHLKYMSQDPTRKEIVDIVTQSLRPIAETLNKLMQIKNNRDQQMQQRMLQQQQEQQQGQQKMGKAQMDMQIKSVKTKAQLQLKGAQVKQNMTLKQMQAMQDMQLKREKAGVDMQVKRRQGESTQEGEMEDAGTTDTLPITPEEMGE